MVDTKTPDQRAQETVTVIRGMSNRDSPDYEKIMQACIRHSIEVAVNEEVTKALVGVAYGAGRDQEILAVREALELATRRGCTLCGKGNRPQKVPSPKGVSHRVHERVLPRDETYSEETVLIECSCPAYLHDLLDYDDDTLFDLVKKKV